MRPRWGTVGVVCALPEELGGLAQRVEERRSRAGLEVLSWSEGPLRVTACVSGIGKVRAARAATLALLEGAEALFVVGVCGGLRRSLAPGSLVHCLRAVQADLAWRAERECGTDGELRRAWMEEVPGPCGWFLTADRPVLSAWRRLRLARAFAGPCVADMETAAVGAVARAAGVPWAALRAVTDGAGAGALLAFRRNYPAQAGRAADTLPRVWRRLVAPTPGGPPA